MKLPLSFKPSYKTDLVRVGRPHDGGYVVGKNSIYEASRLISFGLYDDWSFEKNFLLIRQNVSIYVYDGQVKNFFWVKKILRETIYLLKNQLNIFSYFRNLIIFFKYKNFFRPKNINHDKRNIISSKIKICESNKKNFTSLLDIVKEKNIKDNFFLKIDIEGNEYEILDDIVDVQSQLTGVVIEFHNCYIMRDHIENFMRKFKLDLVHLHVNNYGDITKTGFPNVIEMTFSKRLFNYLRKENDFNFPSISLDQPNNPDLSDEKITFEN